MKRFLLFVVFIFISLYNLHAQEPQRGNFSQMPANGLITGKVMEADLQQPMEFVNLVLFRVRDSSMVTGTVTNLDGTFKITEVPPGKFYLIANFIGYHKQYVENITITPNQSQVDVGVIELHTASTNLEGVEVTAEKQRVEFHIDKKVVNVSQDIQSAGGTAIDVLENTPSVQVDIEGNVTMRGSGSFTVLIDGRPSVLQGSDALQQIPASAIEQIEIITNPSAKYDPDGVAGIINVIMKKQKKPGFNGIVNASAGTGNKYNGNFLLNYRTKSVNLFGGAEYNNYKFGGDGLTTNETYQNDTTSYRISNSERNMGRKGYGIKAGLDLFINDNTTLTLMGKVGNFSFGRGGNTRQHTYTAPATLDGYLVSDNNSDRSGDYYETTISYLQKFDDKGHQIEGMFYYNSETSDDSETQNEYDSDSAWNITDLYPGQIFTTEKGNSHELRIKADYTKPFSSTSKLEAGIQSRVDLQKEDYIFHDYDYSLNEWIVNDLYSTAMDFERQIHAAYGLYSNALKGFEFQIGLRGEYTYRSITSGSNNQSYVINRLDYFPSLHLSKEINEKNQIMASYSRRIERPRGWYLDPFTSYMDPYNIRVGNPALEPEYIDAFDLGYQFHFKNSFVSLDAYHRITNNKITHILTLLDDGIMQHTWKNLNKDYATGTELMANLELTKWLLINGSFDIYYYRLMGIVEGETVDEHSITWESRLNTTFNFNYGIRVQLTGRFEGPSIEAQGREEGSFRSDAAIRKDFFDRNLTLIFSIRDIFKTARHESTSSGIGFYSYNNFTREAPVFTLSVSYKINNYKQKSDRNGSQDDMEIDGGMEF